MPTVERNRQLWNREYEWTEQGEEWSSVWGGSEAQWFGAILPRIHAFVPTSTILEIAPGFGRWTTYLKNYCRYLAVVDLSKECIKACQQRFAADSHISYYLNDGKSLAMIQDKSIDFVFSFDSLVHAEAEVIEAYLNQLAMKLTPNGVGFVHHSNLGKYQRTFSLIDKIPREAREVIVNKDFLASTHGRAASMTAELFADYCDQAGLHCVSQELVNWGTDELLIDCFSMFTPKNSIWARPNNVIENKEFMGEAVLIQRILSRLYTLKSFQSSKSDAEEVSRKPENEETQSAGMALGSRFETWVRSWRKLG